MTTPRPTIITKYILREILTPFLICLFAFTGILLVVRSLKLLELIVNRAADPTQIFSIFLYILPQFLEMSLPMALLLACLLAFSRLSSESELIVLRATGISTKYLLRPLLSFAIVIMLICLSISMYIRPWANFQLTLGMFEIAKSKVTSGLVPGAFNELGSLTIYAETIQGENLGHVMIADRRDSLKPRDFIASHGQVVNDPEKRLVTVRLYNGTMHEGRGEEYNFTQFDTNQLTLNEQELLDDSEAISGKGVTELMWGELRAKIKMLRERAPESLSPKDETLYSRLTVELQRRLVLPTSCIFVALMGMVLGIQPPRAQKGWGASANMTLGILCIALYYFALAIVTAMGEQSVLPAWSVMWIPNILFTTAAIGIFRQVDSERWSAVGQVFGEVLGKIMKRILPI